MSNSLRGLAIAILALAAGPASALAVDFAGHPISCTDPAGATVPVACKDAASNRSDGYAFTSYSFNVLFPPAPPFPPPLPMVAGNDSMRDFFNPILQNLYVFIMGETMVDVIGAPVLYFVTGTLDGVVVTSFSSVVSGLGNPLSWNQKGAAGLVGAGLHTLDLHFGVVQLVPGQQSSVHVSSLYQVGIELPEPATLLLVLSGCALAVLARRSGGTRLRR